MQWTWCGLCTSDIGIFVESSRRRNFDLWSWRERRRVWGDGWADLSISTLWRHCTWDEISEDELVIFLPSLALWSTRTHGSANISAAQSHLRSALCGWIAQLSASESYGACRGKPFADQPALSELIKKSCSLGDNEIAGLLNEAQSMPVAHDRPFLASGSADNSSRYIDVLQCMARMYGDACALINGSGQSCAKPGLEEALLASVHFRFNAAFVYSHLDWAHETFAVGAWLGTLLDRRAAYMPRFVAEYLLELRAGHDGVRTASASEHMFDGYVDASGGWSRLLKCARKTAESGSMAMATAITRTRPGFSFGGLPWFGTAAPVAGRR